MQVDSSSDYSDDDGGRSGFPKRKRMKIDVEQEAKTESAGVAREEPAPAADRRRLYVHLTCVHCTVTHSTFANYTRHLMSSEHRNMMAMIAWRANVKLRRMRYHQRGAQREIERGAAGMVLAARTSFCLVCRLNHRTSRHDHVTSDTHRAMERFLSPYCDVCHIGFESPMVFQYHICICSVEHQMEEMANRPSRQASTNETTHSGTQGAAPRSSRCIIM